MARYAVSARSSTKELFERKPSPLQKTYVVVTTVQNCFLLGAVDTVTSKRSALFQSMGDALIGKVRDMYPGFGPRATYTAEKALKFFPDHYSVLRVTRWWWRMRDELANVNTQALRIFLFAAWHSASLGGYLPVLSDRETKPLEFGSDTAPMSSAIDGISRGQAR